MSSKLIRWAPALMIALAALVVTVTGPLSANQSAAQPKSARTDIAAAKSMGSKSAPVMFEDFSDFQCPVCRQFFLGTIRPLTDEYVASGKVYLVHHDFPLSIHSHSTEAAKWANAAAAIGKFPEVELALYEKQEVWAASGKIDDVVAAVLTPEQMKRVRALYGSAEVESALKHDFDLGNIRSVNQTPSVFITHKGQMAPVPAQGATYSLMKTYIEYLLKQ